MVFYYESGVLNPGNRIYPSSFDKNKTWQNVGITAVIFFLGIIYSLANFSGSHLPNKGMCDSNLRLRTIFVTFKQTPPYK
jgi:hypothetical protein